MDIKEIKAMQSTGTTTAKASSKADKSRKPSVEVIEHNEKENYIVVKMFAKLAPDGGVDFKDSNKHYTCCGGTTRFGKANDWTVGGWFGLRK